MTRNVSSANEDGPRQELLETDRFSVKEIAYALGYKHPNDFSRAFKHFVGKSPKSCRE